MRVWVFALGGLIVWAIHFMGVYGIASVADVLSEADVTAALWATGLFSLACAAADALILHAAVSRHRQTAEETGRFVAWIAAAGAALSLVAVLWQGFPALIGH